MEQFASDSHELIGGDPLVLGPWQLQLLKSCGLRKGSTVLDLGCGTLRGGLHIIQFLDSGCYTGVDPGVRLLELGRQLLDESGLSARQPSLGSLESLDELSDSKFDFVLTQSVLNHLDAAQIEETVHRVDSWLAEDGIWVSTGRISELVRGVEAGAPHPSRPDECLDSTMGAAWFNDLLAAYGMKMSRLTGQEHPRGLDVFEVRRCKAESTLAVRHALQTLVGFDTSSGGSDVRRCVDWLVNKLTEMRFDVDVHGTSAPLVVARRAGTSEGGPAMVFYNHYDTEDANEEDWDTPPHELVRQGDRWFGLGIADNKGALASRLSALSDICESPDIVWIIQGEEETGSAALRQFLVDHPLPNDAWCLDENGNVDPGGLQLLLTFKQERLERAPFESEELAELQRVLGVDASNSRPESRSLNKVYVPGGCAFQAHLPVGGRYLAVGTNDASTRIHAANESIPVDFTLLHILQVRRLVRYLTVQR